MLKAAFYLFFPGGGIGQYTKCQLEALSELDTLQLDVACLPEFQYRDKLPGNVWPGLASISHPVPLIRKMKFLRGQLLNPPRFLRHALRERADILHFCNINHLTFPLWENQLERMGARVSVAVHDVKRSKAILCRPWEEAQLKKFYRKADLLFVHSQHQKSELEDFARVDPAKIEIVPQGAIPFPRPEATRAALLSKWGIKAGRVALVYGQVRDEKNVDGFLEGVKLSGEDDLHIVVAGVMGGGRHKAESHYRERIQALGLEGRVTVLNRYLSAEESGELFTLADWVVLPYNKGFTSMSGVLLVSVYFGKPVLVTPLPSIVELFARHSAGIVCDDESPAALAEGIRRMESAEADEFSAHIKKLQELFSWKANAECVARAFSRVMEGS